MTRTQKLELELVEGLLDEIRLANEAGDEAANQQAWGVLIRRGLDGMALNIIRAEGDKASD